MTDKPITGIDCLFQGVKPEDKENILELAQTATDERRRQDYGHPSKNFERISAGWEHILGVPISNRQVALCMIWVKVARDIHKPTQDNLVDIAGYARTIEMLDE